MKNLLALTITLNCSLCYAITVGAKRSSQYLPLIQNKKVGLVVNQTSKVNDTHLVDYLLGKKVKVKTLFALEHGIRGDFDAGQDVSDSKDPQTGLPIISLYGKNKKPKAQDVKDLDVLIFDIQDVGVRFYTYISSLYYVLEACVEFKKHCIIFDRPNPHANFVAGPIMQENFKSFLGMYPIPVVYGLTIGELTKMIVGEKWIQKTPNYTVIEVLGWKRNMPYGLPVKPSPNLPNLSSIKWYPTLALFEPTVISIGRGTQFPFEVIGYPDKSFGEFTFTPKSIQGMSNDPKHRDNLCFGEDLRQIKAEGFTLKYLEKYFKKYKGKSFFQYEVFFNKLIGNDYVLSMLKVGKSYLEIEKIWQKELLEYKKLREKYLIYR